MCSSSRPPLRCNYFCMEASATTTLSEKKKEREKFVPVISSTRLRWFCSSCGCVPCNSCSCPLKPLLLRVYRFGAQVKQPQKPLPGTALLNGLLVRERVAAVRPTYHASAPHDTRVARHFSEKSLLSLGGAPYPTENPPFEKICT